MNQAPKNNRESDRDRSTCLRGDADIEGVKSDGRLTGERRWGGVRY